jgi:hypothetical protein
VITDISLEAAADRVHAAHLWLETVTGDEVAAACHELHAAEAAYIHLRLSRPPMSD